MVIFLKNILTQQFNNLIWFSMVVVFIYIAAKAAIHYFIPKQSLLMPSCVPQKSTAILKASAAFAVLLGFPYPHQALHFRTPPAMRHSDHISILKSLLLRIRAKVKFFAILRPMVGRIS